MDRVKSLIDDRRALEKQLDDLKKAIALGGRNVSDASFSAIGTSTANMVGESFREVGGIRLWARKVDGIKPKDLRGLVDEGKKQVVSGIVAIITVTEDGKASIAVGVTSDLVDRWSAIELVKVGNRVLGGTGGGGRPDMAQAGGPDGAKAADALKAIEERLAG